MNRFRFGLVVACLVGLLGPPAQAASPPQYRVTVGYRLGFNISAEFTDNVGFPSSATPGPASGGGLDRTYDDGFNRVDISGNAGGQTWNWGYDNASQLPGNDTVVMSSLNIAPVPSQEVQDDPVQGVEINFFSPLAELGPVHFGFELALGYMSVNLRDTRQLTAPTTITSDAFVSGSTIVPVAPYAGSFAGPGPLIGDTPARTVTSGTATINGSRELSAPTYSLRLGPVFELPLTTNLSVSLSGGLAILFIDGELSYAETATVIGGPTRSRAAIASSSQSQVGYYLAGGVNWQFARSWSVFASGQYMSVSDYTIKAGDVTARLNLGGAIFVSAGLGFSF